MDVDVDDVVDVEDDVDVDELVDVVVVDDEEVLVIEVKAEPRCEYPNFLPTAPNLS